MVYLAIKNSRESITYSTLQRNEVATTMVQKWHVLHIPKGVFRKLAVLCCAKQNYNVAPHTLRSHSVSPPTPNPSPLNLPLREPIFIPSQGWGGSSSVDFAVENVIQRCSKTNWVKGKWYRMREREARYINTTNQMQTPAYGSSDCKHTQTHTARI